MEIIIDVSYPQISILYMKAPPNILLFTRGVFIDLLCDVAFSNLLIETHILLSKNIARNTHDMKSDTKKTFLVHNFRISWIFQ